MLPIMRSVMQTILRKLVRNSYLKRIAAYSKKSAPFLGVFVVAGIAVVVALAALFTNKPFDPKKPDVYEDQLFRAIVDIDLNLQEPDIPDRLCTISDFGASRFSASDVTRAIEAAIASCAEAGGGKVVIPAGDWEAYPFALADHIELFLEEGARLSFGDDVRHYGEPILWRFEGVRMQMTPPLISCVGCRDVAIRGKGVIRGNAALWEPYAEREEWWFRVLYGESEEREDIEERTVLQLPEDSFRPEVIGFSRSTNVAIEDITVEDAPRSGIRILMSYDVALRDIAVSTNAFEGDAIVLDSSDGVLVKNVSLASSQGEGISLQAGLNAEGHGMDEHPLQRIRLEDVRITRARYGIAVDRAMSAGMNRIVVDGADVSDAEHALAVHVPEDVYGEVEYAVFSDIRGTEISGESLVSFDVAYDDPLINSLRRKRASTTFESIYFSNIGNGTEGVFDFRNLDHSGVHASRIFVGTKSVTAEK